MDCSFILAQEKESLHMVAEQQDSDDRCNPAQQGAPLTAGSGGQSRQLDPKGFDNIETLSGGEEQWQNWSWKIKTVISGTNGELAEILNAAERTGMKSTEEILREDQFVDANRKASREMYTVLARYTSSEALTIVKSVTELDGVEARARLHANYSRRTLGRMFRVQRECMYPKPAKYVGQVRLAIMQWEEKWKGMLSNLGRYKDSRSLEGVGVAGNLSERCEGTDVDEIGRSRREMREH